MVRPSKITAEAVGLLGQQTQQLAQIVRQRLKAAGLDPALGLLMHRRPRGRSLGIIRHGPPARTM